MTVIEGIGDEVLYSVGALCVCLVTVLGWISTRVNERRITIRRVSVSETPAPQSQLQGSLDDLVPNETTGQFETPPDADITLRQRKSENVTNMNNITPDAGDMQRQDPAVDSCESSPLVDCASQGDDERMVQLRLKFLNDTQKMVDARLDEKVGEFKRRYFAQELARDMIVRLIYNGQLLRSDEEALKNYGIIANCVIHCHISGSPQRGGQQQPAAQRTENEFDVSVFMWPLIGLSLLILWYFRIAYKAYFTVTATFALIGLTFLYLVSLSAAFYNTGERVLS